MRMNINLAAAFAAAITMVAGTVLAADPAGSTDRAKKIAAALDKRSGETVKAATDAASKYTDCKVSDLQSELRKMRSTIATLRGAASRAAHTARKARTGLAKANEAQTADRAAWAESVKSWTARAVQVNTSLKAHEKRLQDLEKRGRHKCSSFPGETAQLSCLKVLELATHGVATAELSTVEFLHGGCKAVKTQTAGDTAKWEWKCLQGGMQGGSVEYSALRGRKGSIVTFSKSGGESSSGRSPVVRDGPPAYSRTNPAPAASSSKVEMGGTQNGQLSAWVVYPLAALSGGVIGAGGGYLLGTPTVLRQDQQGKFLGKTPGTQMEYSMAGAGIGAGSAVLFTAIWRHISAD